MTEKVKCTIDSICKSKRKIKPIIVSFEHGKLEPKHASKLRCGVYQDNLKNQVVAVETRDNYLYQGTKESGKLTNTLIAIRNKTTNKVRLFEASTIQLSPVIEQPQVPEITKASTSSVSNLNKSFGSKRSIRRSEQYDKTRTTAETMTEQLSKAIENVSGELDVDKTDIGEYTFLPPRNPEAYSPDLVYELHNILTSSELEELEQEAHSLLEFPENYDNNENSILFSKLVRQVIAGKNTKLVAALLYMECIVRLLSCDRYTLQTFLNNVCPFSKLINDNIRNTFTQAEGRKRQLSTTSKDKALCYLIVLGLMVTNFEFDISLIARSIQLDQDRLRMLCKVVGVTPMKDNVNIVTLKLPLPKIKLFSRKNKKRK